MIGWILVEQNSGQPIRDLYNCIIVYPKYKDAYKFKTTRIRIKKVTILELRERKKKHGKKTLRTNPSQVQTYPRPS